MPTPTYSYDDSETTPKDRVRGLMGDVSGSPWRFSDGRIQANLDRAFQSDPLAGVLGDSRRELRVAIALLETLVISTGQTRTIRQGSVSRTTKDAETGGYEAVLASLRLRLGYLSGAGSGISVVQPDYPDLDRRHGYPDLSDPYVNPAFGGDLTDPTL